jgi:hypothetical protein
VAGVDAPRARQAADVLVNAGMVGDGTARISRDLQQRGFILDGVSPEGIGHRFAREGVHIDVLGPDGVGSRARLFSVAGARTVVVPGGTQALKRSHKMTVRAGSTRGTIPTPNTLGALLVKLRAIDMDDQPDAQRRDVAFLLSLVADPDPLERQASRTPPTPSPAPRCRTSSSSETPRPRASNGQDRPSALQGPGVPPASSPRTCP